MKITSTGINMKITPSLRERVEDKLGKFEKYFGDKASADVKFSSVKNQIEVEITMKIYNKYYRGETMAEDAYTAFDAALDRIEGQIRKHKTRFEKRIRDHSYMKEYLKDQVLSEETEDLPKIIKHKTFEITPLDPEEATLQMEMLGHSFLLFLNTENNKVNLVYKRKDGNYGLIEPEY